jgi:hypothetical protein
MTRWIGLTLTVVFAGLIAVPTPAPSQGKGVAKIMAEKLKSSQLLLEGLALSDFDKITKSAERLIQLTKTEEWMVHKTPRYEVHSNEFRRAAEVIVQKAQAKNIDGVAYAYLDLTMTCVRCHQYVREVRDARLPGERPEVLFARIAK